MNSDINKLAREFSDDLIKEARRLMSSEMGVNKKTGTNTLHNSDLYKKLEAEVQQNQDDLIINVLFNFYIVYINWERPPFYKKWPRVDAIKKWIISKNICPTNLTINQFTYLVGKSIYEKGHAARPILDTLFNNTNKLWENHYAEQFFLTTIKPIIDYFN